MTIVKTMDIQSEEFRSLLADATVTCKIANRIACPEGGYPHFEGLYHSVEEWELSTGEVFEHALMAEMVAMAIAAQPQG